MVFEFHNYRAYLAAVLDERARRNPGYSLRAMARQLGISPASLSLVIQGKRNLSAATALGAARRLRLDGRETEYFCLLVQHETARTPELKATLLEKLSSTNPSASRPALDLDQFKLIAEWYHLAILELTELARFRFTPERVARRLGISALQARTAIARLERLGMLVREEGRYRRTQTAWTIGADVPDQGLRRFHRQMLEKAAESLQTQSPTEKVVGSETFAFDPRQLPEARRLIDEFFGKMVALAAQGERKSEVFHFGVQLFNLTPERKPHEEN